MKYAQISIKATLKDHENVQYVLEHLRALLPADRVQIDCQEYVELSTDGKNQVVWLRDDDLDLPWERVAEGFGVSDGDELTEAASNFITEVGIVKALYGTYPDVDKYGMPAWASHDSEDNAEAKFAVADYGFAMTDKDFEVAASCTHDDGAGSMWLMVCLSDEDYATFEALQLAPPAAELAG